MKNIFLILFSLCSFNLFSQDWIQVSSNERMGVSNYFKEEYVSHEDYIVTIWGKEIFNEFKYKEKSYVDSYFLSLYQFDLENTKYRIISQVFYNSVGEKIYSAPFPDNPWKFIPPDSIGESQLRFVKSLISN